MDGLSIERFVLVGHSLVGAVAIACASAHQSKSRDFFSSVRPEKISVNQAEQIMTVMESDDEKVLESCWDELLTGAQPQVLPHVKNEGGFMYCKNTDAPRPKTGSIK